MIVPTNLQHYLENEFYWFHRHPELSLEEYQTTDRIRSILEEAGITILDTGLKTGLVAQVSGQKEGPVVAIRSDIDALPVEEQTGLSYRSEVSGKMHACGHDFHLTSLLGAALLLQEQRDELAGTVKLIFQPAEEVFAGAKQVLESQVLEDVEAIFGIHCSSEFPVGTVGVREGAVSAAVDRFQIRLTGFGSHAAYPELGVDPIVALTTLVTSLQTIISRNISSFDNSLISVTHIEAGNTWNVIPETGWIEGTVRTLSREQRTLIKKRLIDMSHHIAAAYQVTADVEWTEGPPATANDDFWAERVREVVREQGLTVGRTGDSLGGEDFAFYQEKLTGVFVQIGTDPTYPNHHPKFQINPQALESTARLLAGLGKRSLEIIRRKDEYSYHKAK